MPIPQPQPPIHSDTFNQTLLGYVEDKLRSWGVPGHVRQSIISDWRNVRQWMTDQNNADVLTIKTMLPLLKKYVDTKLTEEEKTAMVMTRLSAERDNALRNMSDRAVLEAIYRKLHE